MSIKDHHGLEAIQEAISKFFVLQKSIPIQIVSTMTKYIITAIVVGSFEFLGISVCAQVEGLWEISKVTVLAKWTRINSDFTYQSGNGWLQNSEGNWTFDQNLNQFLPIEKHGIVDDFGPFEVEIIEDRMTWTRQENGEAVKVHFERIEDLPKGPADKLQGLWDLKNAVRGEENLMSSYDPDNNRYYHIRWDRIYVDDLGPAGRQADEWSQTAANFD